MREAQPGEEGGRSAPERGPDPPSGHAWGGPCARGKRQATELCALKGLEGHSACPLVASPTSAYSIPYPQKPSGRGCRPSLRLPLPALHGSSLPHAWTAPPCAALSPLRPAADIPPPTGQSQAAPQLLPLHFPEAETSPRLGSSPRRTVS